MLCFINIHWGHHRWCSQISPYTAVGSMCLKFLYMTRWKQSGKTSITQEINTVKSTHIVLGFMLVLSMSGSDRQLIQASLFKNLTASLKPSSHKSCMLPVDGGKRAWFRRLMFSTENWGNQRKHHMYIKDRDRKLSHAASHCYWQ